jgi:hypothetical protein
MGGTMCVCNRGKEETTIEDKELNLSKKQSKHSYSLKNKLSNVLYSKKVQQETTNTLNKFVLTQNEESELQGGLLNINSEKFISLLDTEQDPFAVHAENIFFMINELRMNPHNYLERLEKEFISRIKEQYCNPCQSFG